LYLLCNIVFSIHLWANLIKQAPTYVKEDNLTDELVIKGRNIFIQGQLIPASIVINEGKITGIMSDLHAPQTDQVIDAGENLVLPGVVDVHVHFRDMGEAHKEDWWTGSCAAAAGGVTTVVDEPNNVPDTVNVDVLKRKMGLAAKQSLVDYTFTMGLTPDNLGMINEFASHGVASYEIFEGGDGDYPYITDTGDVYEALQKVRRVGGLCCLNAREAQLKTRLSKRIKEGKGFTVSDLSGNSPGVEEAIGASKNMLLAGETGTRVHLREISSAQTIGVLRRLKPPNLTAEVTPYHLLLTKKDADRLGPYGLVLPPLKSSTDVEALWYALNEGVFDAIASDHAPHTRENKEPGWENIWEAPPGVPVIQPMLSLMLTQAFKGRSTLQKIVEALTVKPAQIFGLYPRKGSIQIGTDADFVFVDAKRKKVIGNDMLFTKCGWTPFEGIEVKGIPVRTVVRGKTVMETEAVIAEPGHGQFIPAD
jgi:dihydroorotase (multifunctional complex type)